MDTLLRDVRYLLRSVRSSPAFSTVVILTIAVAVGATTALFSVVDPLLLRAEPFADPARLVALWESPPRADGGVAPGKNEVSPGTLGDWTAERAVFDGVAAVAPWRPNLTGIDEPTRLNATAVSREFFQTLGARPLLGRVFVPEESTTGKNTVVVLSYAFWQQRFGGDSGIVGRELTLSGRKYTVVGVMPDRFQLRYPLPQASDLWRPMVLEGRDGGESARPLPVCVRSAATRRLARARAVGVGRARGAPGGRLSRDESRLGRAGDPVARGHRERRAAAAARRRRGGRARAADRVRERREPAARAWCITRPRSRAPHGARRHASADRSAARDRERCARRHRCADRSSAGPRARGRARAIRTAGVSVECRDRAERSRDRVRGSARDHHWRRVWSCARAVRGAHVRGRCTARRWPSGFEWPSGGSDARCAGGAWRWRSLSCCSSAPG